MAVTPVIVAFGVQFRDLAHVKAMREFLDSKARRSKAETDHWLFPKNRPVKYDIRIVFTKKELAKALNTRDAIVIYDGHARYGQGPALTPIKNTPSCPADKAVYPVNPWEDHFRMGFDVVKTKCIEDIQKHATNPVEFSGTKVPQFVSRSVKTLIRQGSRGARSCSSQKPGKRKILGCHPKMAKLQNCRGSKGLLHRHFWESKPEGKELYTIVRVGAKDLLESRLLCKVFFMNSCLTLSHYLRSLRRQKKATRSRCVFYLTRRTAYMALSRASQIFLERILEGLDPTRSSGAARVTRAMNKGNPGIFKRTRIKDASGLIVFRR